MNAVQAKARPPYAIDYEALSIGDIIPREHLEKMLGISATSARYGLALVAVIESIRRERPDLDAHVGQRKGSVVIVDDPAAEDKSRRRIEGHVRGMGREIKRRASIDYSKLTTAQRAIAEGTDKAVTASAHFARKELLAAQRRKLLT